MKKIENVVKMISDICCEKNNKVVFTTSFGIEDQVITDIIIKNKIPIKIVSIDTGRLFPETYSVWQKTIEKYSCEIEVFCADNNEIEKLLSNKGPFSFYQSVENRKECCYIRKVVPLKRALNGMKYWITGIRAEQTELRQNMKYSEYDEELNITKINPLLDWTLEEVEKYLSENNVPYNILHDKGFVSIGCAPCTRAIKKGESFRDGRWWWESNSGKECGLHTRKK